MIPHDRSQEWVIMLSQRLIFENGHIELLSVKNLTNKPKYLQVWPQISSNHVENAFVGSLRVC